MLVVGPLFSATNIYLKMVLDHLGHPYSKCLMELQDQQDIDAYQEMHKTNYTTQVRPIQCLATCV